MTITSNVAKSDASSHGKPSAFRRILPQVIATTVKNLHMIDWGLTDGITSIMLPALTGIPNEQNNGEFISLTAAQSSWVVSISYLFQIFGGLCSGLITEPIGRKRSMFFINIPFAVGWFLLSQTTQTWHMFLGLSLLGCSTGLMEPSVVTYVGEISEPSTRGVLMAYSGMMYTAGMLIIFILNAWMPWRSVALVCLLLPITCAILLCFIPETPQWLLSKKRTKQAEKSLQWLRGWTTKEVVANEFHELQRHSERSNACDACIKQDVQCHHPPPTLVEKLSEIRRKKTLKPCVIITSLFFLGQYTGAYAMRSFIAQIFKAYESPIAIDNTMMALGVSDNLSKFLFLCLLRLTGKRKFYLTMLFGVFISSFMISCYGFLYLPKGLVSFNQQNQTSHLENRNLAYIPVVLLFMWNFCSFGGFLTLPWLMLSELLPFKTRSICSGGIAALSYAMVFVSQKTYYDFEMTLSLPGTTLLYSVISCGGLILMYYILPETENRTLEEIELHFADDSKKLTDRKIEKKQ